MQVKVWNKNVHPYKEFFRGRDVVIEPQSYIEMDEDEAEYFRASFTFPKKDEQGRPDPLYFKKISIERPAGYSSAEQLVCHANGQSAKSQAELEKVLGTFAHLLVRDEHLDAEASKSGKSLKKENKVLMSRIEKLETILEQQFGIKFGGENDKSE